MTPIEMENKIVELTKTIEEQQNQITLLTKVCESLSKSASTHSDMFVKVNDCLSIIASKISDGNKKFDPDKRIEVDPNKRIG